MIVQSPVSRIHHHDNSVLSVNNQRSLSLAEWIVDDGNIL